MTNKQKLFILLAFFVLAIAAYLNNCDTPDAYFPTKGEVKSNYPNILYKDTAEETVYTNE